MARSWSIVAAALVLAFTSGVTAAGGGTTYRPCAPGADLHFTAGDKTRLVGHRFGRGRTAVVLAHQLRGNVCQWAPYAKRLASLGFTAIAFDFRGNGLSQTRSYPASRRLAADVAAAVKVARRLGATKVVLVGASLGGTAVLVAAPTIRPAVQGVVSLSGPADFGTGLDALAAVKRLQVPVRYFAAELDAGFADDARSLFEATATSDKALELVPGGDHGVQLVARPGRVRSLVEDFIRSR
jgi:pimeloyl-ACP methyl ester carboxylesterase